MNFPKNLKMLRKAANLTQSDLAKLLNISHKTLSHWEGGYSQPDLCLLAKLKEALAVTYDDLID